MSEEKEQESNKLLSGRTMSEQDKAIDETDLNKRRLVMLTVIGFVMALVFVIGVWFVFNVPGHSVIAIDNEIKAKQAAYIKQNSSAIYYEIYPVFVVNYTNNLGRQGLLQIGVTILTYSANIVSALRANLPTIRNELIDLYGGRTSEELATFEGQDGLKKETLKIIQKILKEKTGDSGIEAVYFTEFMMR